MVLNKTKKRTVRVFMLVALMTLCLSFGAILHAYATDSGQFAEDLHITIDVYAGDTLWSIAAQYAPDDIDKRKYIYMIKKLNGLKSSAIQEGQQLLLP